MNWENRGWGGGGESKIEQRKTVQEQEAKMARKTEHKKPNMLQWQGTKRYSTPITKRPLSAVLYYILSHHEIHNHKLTISMNTGAAAVTSGTKRCNICKG